MKITIVDDLPPEAIAMTQALYSRSPNYVDVHLAKVKEVGADKFMDKFYVGYGHKSIGDCGTTTIFIERVSLLAAKAIQNNQLYNGQEASTRYMNLFSAYCINPLNTAAGEEVLHGWRDVYSKLVFDIEDKLHKDWHCANDDPRRFQFYGAIRARAFDICRGFLPAGITTNLSWHTNLRQAADHLKNLLAHPLDEVKSIARVIIQELQAKYPSSFGFKEYQAEQEYLERVHENYYKDRVFDNTEAVFSNDLDIRDIECDLGRVQPRPPKSELPNDMRRHGGISATFAIDYGSYRDFQRQRSVTQNTPLLTMDNGFHPWYTKQIPDYLWQKHNKQIQSLTRKTQQIADCYRNSAQYYIPIGYQVIVHAYMPFNAAVYIAELRSGNTVHPTLRPIAQQIGRHLQHTIDNCVFDLHVDWSSDDDWHPLGTKRGKQTIIEK